MDKYNSILQSELNKMLGIGIALLIVLIAIVVYSVVLIKEDRKKKFPYIQLVCVVLISIFLTVSFGYDIILYSKDINNEAYIQYEGPISISEKRRVVFGNIPTWYKDYVISFKYNGETVELATRKDYGIQGNIENCYIVYAENSKEILELQND